MNIIDIGLYKTRSGLLVEIYEVKSTGATFNRHGYLHTKTKHGRAKKQHNIWDALGRYTAFEGHALDIIEIIK